MPAGRQPLALCSSSPPYPLPPRTVTSALSSHYIIRFFIRSQPRYVYGKEASIERDVDYRNWLPSAESGKCGPVRTYLFFVHLPDFLTAASKINVVRVLVDISKPIHAQATLFRLYYFDLPDAFICMLLQILSLRGSSYSSCLSVPATSILSGSY